MRVFRTTYRTRDGQTREASKWYIEVRDHLAIVRRFPAFTDKGQSGALGRQIERLIRYRAAGEQPDPQLSRWLEQVPESLPRRFVSIGRLDSARASAGKPLSQHVNDFEQALRDKGDTDQQATQVASRVRRIVEGCKFQTWTDIQASRIQRYIAERRQDEAGISCQTANFHLAAIKQFAAWMVSDRRAGESPVAHLKGFKAGEVREDRRHPRRALEVDEARRLLDAARKAPRRFGMSGAERSMLYRLADMIKADLAATEEVDAQGSVTRKAIPYVDETGRYADFHSLRHTTGSFLAAAGVHPKVAQEILRHSRIELTMGIYTHTLHGQQSEAVAKLPDLSLPSTESQQAKTGTDDSVLASCLARQGGKEQTSVDGHGQIAEQRVGDTEAENPCSQANNEVSDAESRQAAVGFEPTDNGFANRRLWPLGYAAGVFHTSLSLIPIPVSFGNRNFLRSHGRSALRCYANSVDKAFEIP